MVAGIAMWPRARTPKRRSRSPQRPRRNARRGQKLDSVRAEIKVLRTATRHRRRAQRCTGVCARRRRSSPRSPKTCTRSMKKSITAGAARQTRCAARRTRNLAEDTARCARRVAALGLRARPQRGTETAAAAERRRRHRRVLAYYRYFERARIGHIDQLSKDLERLPMCRSRSSRKPPSWPVARCARGEERH